MMNTPPVYPVWVLSLVLEWMESLGGVVAIEKINRHKAESLYQAIDASSLYRNPVKKDCRSLMNVPFVLADDTHMSRNLLKHLKMLAFSI